MKRASQIAGVTCVLVTIAIGHTSAQTSRVEGGVRSLAGVDFYWETRLVPPVPSLDERLRMLTLRSGSDTVHRIMVDQSQKVYFGYDARVTVDKTEPAPTYRIAFGPLSFTPQLQQILGADAKTWKLLPAPRFPAPRVVRSGEVLELTLLTSGAWGQQMTEYVTLQEPRRQGFDPEPPREFAFAVGAPRDLTAGDVELRLDQPWVITTYPSTDAPPFLRGGGNPRDGAGVVATFKSPGNASGPIMWVYLPGRGRFLLSLTPRSGFQRAGEVRGTSMRFTVNGQTYDIGSTARIAPATAAFNLYVLRQPKWTPAYKNANLDTIHIGAADRLEYLVDKKFDFTLGRTF